MTAELITPVIKKPHARATHAKRAPQVPQPVQHSSEGIDNIVTALAVACVEILQGQRSASTLMRWATPELVERLRRFARLRHDLARTRQAPASRIAPGKARICRVNASTVEASVNIMSPDRRRAIALRLENTAGRWLLTQLVVV